MDLIRAVPIINAFLDADIPPFLWGASGIGKSDIVKEIGGSRKLPIIDFRAILRDPVDLRGLPAVINGEARWLPPSDLPNEEKHGKEGILFLDELNTASPAVQAACFGLVLDRKVGEYYLPKGWKIIAAGNRKSDRAAAQTMPSALANRFAHIDVEPSIDAYSKWALSNDIDSMVIAFLRYRPTLLHNMPAGEPRAFPTPRSWSRVSKIVNGDEPLRLAKVTSLVGEGAAAEFEGFVRTFKQLPRLDDILKNPTGTPLPSEPSARFAVTTALARKVTADTFGNAIIYMDRMPREFTVTFVMDACAIHGDVVTQTKAFIGWSVRNQDILIN